MFEALFGSDTRRAQKILQEIDLFESTAPTDFNDLFLCVRRHILLTKAQIEPFVKAVRKNADRPQSMLKCLVMLHLVLQDSKDFNTEAVLDLLDAWLMQSDKMLAKQTKKQTKNRSFISKSLDRSTSSTCSEDSPLNKQSHLISQTIKPYIAFLLRVIGNVEDYRLMIGLTETTKESEAWRMINHLKTIGSIAEAFKMIGRYFVKDYGHLVLLISKALMKEVNRCYPKLRKYVLISNKRAALGEQRHIQGLVSLLKEIGILNDSLMQLFLGKYFYRFLMDCPEPRWINNGGAEFDALFNRWKSQNQQPARTRSRFFHLH